MKAMKWIVGVDAEGRSRGALHFARWLADATGSRWVDACVPVHVLDHEHLRMMLRYHHLDEAIEAGRTAAERQIAEVFSGNDAPEPEVVQALSVEEGLEASRARHGADGVIVGRSAPRQSHRVFRLGAVARRMLRRPASPVIVVPPDLTAFAVGSGPLVALSSLAPDSLEACRLARAIAESARRELAVVHVVPERHPGSAGPLAKGSRGRSSQVLARRERALARWVAQHEVWPDLTAVIDGDVAGAALAFAEARRAALVAVGAHPSTSLRHALAPKLWRRLAAVSRQAVVIAPAPASALAWRLGESRDEEDGRELASADRTDLPG